MRQFAGRWVLGSFLALMALTMGLYVWISSDVAPHRVDETAPSPPPLLTADTPGRTADVASLPPLPEFPFESMEPAVRRQFEEARERVLKAPDDAKAARQLALLFHAYSFQALALPCYQRALALDSSDWRWRYGYGIALFETGAWEAAAQALEMAFEANPKLAWASYYWGECYRRLGQYERALGGYARALELSPAHARAHLGAGQCELRLGNLDLAIQHASNAITIEPEYGAARYALGQMMRKRGKMEAAREQLRLAELHRDTEPRQVDPFEELLAALRTGAVDALHRGIELAQLGRVNDALPFLERAVNSNAELPEAHAQLGAAYLSLGRIEDARKALTRAIQLNRESADAHYHLGLLAHRVKDYDAAVGHFEQALAIRPAHFDALLGLGTDLPRVGRWQEGVERLSEAAALRPGDGRPWKRTATAYAIAGEYAQAESTLRAGVRALPDDLSLQDRLAWLLATCPDDSIRRPEEALKIASDVVFLTRHEEPQPLESLAAALAALGQFADAQVAADQARQAAISKGRPDLAERISAQSAEYREGRPWRSPAR